MNITYNPENENERQVVAVINSAVGEAQAEAGMWSQTPEPVDVETIDDEPQAVSLEAVRERRQRLGVHQARRAALRSERRVRIRGALEKTGVPAVDR